MFFNFSKNCSKISDEITCSNSFSLMMFSDKSTNFLTRHSLYLSLISLFKISKMKLKKKFWKAFDVLLILMKFGIFSRKSIIGLSSTKILYCEKELSHLILGLFQFPFWCRSQHQQSEINPLFLFLCE